MNKKIIIFVLLLIIASGIGVWFYFNYQKEIKEIQLQSPQEKGVITPRPEEVEGPKEEKIAEFVPLKSPPSPPFLESLNEAKDVKIDFHYEGDYSEFSWYKFYTSKDSNEKFLSLSKLKREKGEYVYGPNYYSVFSAETSHWYGGSPIYLLNPESKYSVSYIGFKINNRDLISELKVEFGIDYLAHLDIIGNSKSSIFSSIFGVESVYACGPGGYLRLVGDSNLIFVKESNDIAWYRLEKPIALYNLPLSYCDADCSSLPNCPAWAEPPPGCEDYPWCCHWNFSISSLEKGNLRMHIFYKPNDKEGFLKLQVVNLILSDPEERYYQPIMGENFDHYYRAYLH